MASISTGVRVVLVPCMENSYFHALNPLHPNTVKMLVQKGIRFFSF